MTAIKEKTAADLLTAAADYIHEHGLFKGWFYDADANEEFRCDGPVCARGALNVALTGFPIKSRIFPRPPAETAAYRWLAEAIRLSGHALPADVEFWRSIGGSSDLDVIVNWNDAPEREKDEVVAVMRKAAELAGMEA